MTDCAVRGRWRGLELDALSTGELERITEPVIALDAAGRVVAMSAAAARWVGVAAWQAKGRELSSEFGWRFGRSAVESIRSFVGASIPCLTIRAEPTAPRTATSVALLRGDQRIYLAVAA